MSVDSNPNNVNSDGRNDDSEVAPWGTFSYPNYRRYWFASLARVFGIQFRFLGAAGSSPWSWTNRRSGWGW
jgi:hypothetical protein